MSGLAQESHRDLGSAEAENPHDYLGLAQTKALIAIAQALEETARVLRAILDRLPPDKKYG